MWRPAGGGSHVLLVHRPKYDDWGFAKGKLEPGEHPLLAAVREAEEETGLRVALGRRLPPVHYAVSGTPKRVDYWAATVEREAAAFTPNREIDAVAWVAAAAAGSRLTYQRDVETLAAFRAGPRPTVPLILLRHASAGSKDDWPGDDVHRPLDAVGMGEAAALADLLRCFGTSRVLSAPAERCIATVRPYADTTGTEIKVEPAFDIAGGDGGAAWAGAMSAGEKAVAELATTDQPVIICAHRENIPVLLAAACIALCASGPASTQIRKSEFLVLHRAAGVLAALERYHPDGVLVHGAALVPDGAVVPEERRRGGSWQAHWSGGLVKRANPWAASRVSAAVSLRG